MPFLIFSPHMIIITILLIIIHIKSLNEDISKWNSMLDNLYNNEFISRAQHTALTIKTKWRYYIFNNISFSDDNTIKDILFTDPEGKINNIIKKNYDIIDELDDNLREAKRKAKDAIRPNEKDKLLMSSLTI